jgi:hypothetical protein
MDVVHDVLDNRLVDVEDRPMGRVDGIVSVWEKDQPLRITHIEVGMLTLAGRLSRHVAEIARRLPMVNQEPYRIDIHDVSKFGIDVVLKLNAEDTPLLEFEQWLRRNVIGRMPGGK